ncbi:MAG: VWA domain-containing protein, partial [Candidatus Eisenbacteria bacterium]|nr:VWA domain-containing protein [Candidatus Eisenbacteria bacterium]
MNFLNPLFLFGLAAASIPILIHLFTRRKPREILFPSLAFLSEVQQSEIRRLKLKQWLLLLLRTLAVACLALAMARPAIRGSFGQGSAPTTVVVLVDRSGSMSAGSREGTLFAAARRAVEHVLASLGPADEVLLVPYDAAAAPLSPEPSTDMARVRGALQSLAPGAATTNHRAALEAAARALSASRRLNKELFWLSDLQAAGFGTDSLPAALRDPAFANARIYLVPFATTNRANAALTDASLAPAETGGALEVGAQGFDAQAGDLAVEVQESDGSSLGRGFIALPARGSAGTLLPLSRVPAIGARVSIPDDALPLDNQRWVAAGRDGGLRVVLREDGESSPLRLALEAGSPASGLVVRAAGATEMPEALRSADVVVLNDLERLGAAEAQAVLDHHRAGGAVLVVFGARADAAWWNESVLGALGLGRLGDPVAAASGASWRLMRAVADHAVLSGFPARAGEPLSSARFFAIRGFTPAAAARPLLEFDRSHPALIEAPHALALVASFGAGASDLSTSGAFLPLLHQMVKVLGRGSAAPSLEPGERFTMPATTGPWRIEDADGRELPSELVTRDGATHLESERLERPGLYRVTQAGALRASFAVNPSPAESD